MADHIIMNEHLTKAGFDGAVSKTYLGQAHFAGTGPTGKTCRECIFWHQWKWKKPANGKYERVSCSPDRYGKAHRIHAGEPKKARCNRPIANKANRLIPHFAEACRLFEPGNNIMPLHQYSGVSNDYSA
ncbi:hypothetical protein [Ochrobactrum sp. AN78]|uniref:hypothetical protein n=1 Tax=Ochrobactrum sp. AN78 TaxID=3039853 RepID=UPI002989F556|nr:hypothetical protein [Ochrobactrum sp. AN78]MDH7790710.1 hypothetical protein [Ochrobactrum sp. AN78]